MSDNELYKEIILCGGADSGKNEIATMFTQGKPNPQMEQSILSNSVSEPVANIGPESSPSSKSSFKKKLKKIQKKITGETKSKEPSSSSSSGKQKSTKVDTEPSSELLKTIRLDIKSKPFLESRGRNWKVTEVKNFVGYGTYEYAKLLKDLLLALPRDKDKSKFDYYCFVVRLDDFGSVNNQLFWEDFKEIFSAENKDKFVLIVTGCDDVEKIIVNTNSIQSTLAGVFSIVYWDDNAPTASLDVLEGQLKRLSRGQRLITEPSRYPSQVPDNSSHLMPIKKAISLIKQAFNPVKVVPPMRKILLVGSQGAGKSTIGNMLIQGKLKSKGPNSFDIHQNSANTSTHVEACRGSSWEVCEVRGFHEFVGKGEKKAYKLVHLIKQTDKFTEEGYHHIAYVVNARNFKRESEEKSFNFFKEIFKSCQSNFVVIFTHCDEEWLRNNSIVLSNLFGTIPKLYCDFPFDQGNPWRRNKNQRAANLHKLDSDLRGFGNIPLVPQICRSQKKELASTLFKFLGTVSDSILAGLIQSDFF